MSKEKEINQVSAMSSEKMLKEANEAKRKIKYNDRVTLEITSSKLKHYRKGQIINPHRLVAEQMIKNKVAVEIKKD